MAKKKQTNETFLGAVFTDEGGELIHNYDLWRNDMSDDAETILKYSVGIVTGKQIGRAHV